MSGNYYRKLSVEIITGNYELVYYDAEKCGNYRDTCISKNIVYFFSLNTFLLTERVNNNYLTS